MVYTKFSKFQSCNPISLPLPSHLHTGTTTLVPRLCPGNRTKPTINSSRVPLTSTSIADGNPKAKGAAEPSELDDMEAAYTEIKFLLLSFEATDLPNLWDEVVSVQFSLDYVDLRGSQADYEWLSIKLRDSEVDVKNKLQSFLPPAGKANHETLYVIYYSGHACFKNGQGLVFRR